MSRKTKSRGKAKIGIVVHKSVANRLYGETLVREHLPRMIDPKTGFIRERSLVVNGLQIDCFRAHEVPFVKQPKNADLVFFVCPPESGGYEAELDRRQIEEQAEDDAGWRKCPESFLATVADIPVTAFCDLHLPSVKDAIRESDVVWARRGDCLALLKCTAMLEQSLAKNQSVQAKVMLFELDELVQREAVLEVIRAG